MFVAGPQRSLLTTGILFTLAALVACGADKSPSDDTSVAGQPAMHTGGAGSGQGGSAGMAMSSAGTHAAGVAGTGGAAAPSGGGGSGAVGGAQTAGTGAGGAGGASAGSGGAPSTAGSAGAPAGGAGAATGGTGGAPSTGGASSADATVVPDPSWACGVPNGLVPPEKGKLVFKATLQLGDINEVGETQYGKRRQLDVSGGTVTGEKIQATVLKGGLDYELTLSTGSMEIEQINLLRTSDNALIYVRSCGFAPAGDSVSRFVPDFEAASSGSYAWLNQGKYAGTRVVNQAMKTMELAVYDVAGVAAGATTVKIQDPSGVPNQPWECNTTKGTRGAMVFTENVTLGSSISTGQSKNGNRNVIPITGGTVTGRVQGTIVPGGADYQSNAGLDARYTLKANDGEYIIVRNCGPGGALIPWFEARVAGPYAFLNANTFLSSDPGVGGGGVSITFYERQ